MKKANYISGAAKTGIFLIFVMAFVKVGIAQNSLTQVGNTVL